MKRIAIFGNTHQEKKSAKIFRLLELLAERGAEVMIEKKFYNFVQRINPETPLLQQVTSFEGNNFSADLVISFSLVSTPTR